MATSPHILPPSQPVTGQPTETRVMVLFDVQPDSIGLDGRHTPKITKGGERSGWGEAIDKAGTHRLIKIYSFSPSPSALAGQKGGGENVISELRLPGCLWLHVRTHVRRHVYPDAMRVFSASPVCLWHAYLLRAKGVKNNLVVCSANSGPSSCSCVSAPLSLSLSANI